MAHILQGIECPPSDGAFSARPGAIVGRIVGGKASDPVMMSITAAQLCQAASMGALRRLRPTTRGQCFRRRQRGRLDPPHPTYTPFHVSATNVGDVGG
jgi:hypothetical protein